MEMFWSVLDKAKDALNKARECSSKALGHATNEARHEEGCLERDKGIKKSVNATDVVLVQAHVVLVRAPCRWAKNAIFYLLRVLLGEHV